MGLFSGIVGGVLGLGSTLLGNKSAKQEAQNNRDFQEDMSNTSVQRRVADMKKAGINPLLAVQSAQGGASTPSGAQADIKHFDPNSINTLSNARLLQAQAKAQEQDNELHEFRKQALQLENRLKDVQSDLLKAQTSHEAVKIIKTTLESQGLNITNKQAWEAYDLIRMQNEIRKKGFTDEMFQMYPGLFAEMYSGNSASPTSAITNTVINSAKRYFDDVSKKFKKNKENGGFVW